MLFSATLAAAEDFTGRVVGVHDGDTITVMHQGRGERVRLHGIDAPERGPPFTDRVKKFVSDLCYHKEVKVETKGRDRHQRTLASLPNSTTYLRVIPYQKGVTPSPSTPSGHSALWSDLRAAK